jgi:hypothetical protein
MVYVNFVFLKLKLNIFKKNAKKVHLGLRQNQKNLYYAQLVVRRVLSSVGRASPLQGECQRFDPVSTHHFTTTLYLQ